MAIPRGPALDASAHGPSCAQILRNNEDCLRSFGRGNRELRLRILGRRGQWTSGWIDLWSAEFSVTERESTSQYFAGALAMKERAAGEGVTRGGDDRARRTSPR
jgi:hypothetical protein